MTAARRGVALALAVLVLDQASKAAVLAWLSEPITVSGFFNLVLVWNQGVSFGMLGGLGAAAPWLLILLALGVALALAVWLRHERRLPTALALGLVIGGAIGNAIDRARFGAVVDFLDFHLAGYHWPAFNVADSAIVVGAGLLVLDGLRAARPATKQP